MNWDRIYWDFGGERTRNADINGVHSNLIHPGNETMISAPLSSNKKL